MLVQSMTQVHNGQPTARSDAAGCCRQGPWEGLVVQYRCVLMVDFQGNAQQCMHNCLAGVRIFFCQILLIPVDCLTLSRTHYRCSIVYTFYKCIGFMICKANKRNIHAGTSRSQPSCQLEKQSNVHLFVAYASGPAAAADALT